MRKITKKYHVQLTLPISALYESFGEGAFCNGKVLCLRSFKSNKDSLSFAKQKQRVVRKLAEEAKEIEWLYSVEDEELKEG